MLATQKLIGSSEDNARQQKHCNCKRSNCLKLYCECFTSGVYCHKSCNCINCFNNQKTEYLRRTAVETTLDRNPNAFRPKIAADNKNMLVVEGRKAAPVRHNKGCHCKKSWCLKKYCECFQANIYCTSKCKCHDCKNFEGSVFRDKIAPRPLSSAAVDSRDDDSGQQDSDTDSLDQDIRDAELRMHLNMNPATDASNDDADTQASASTDDRKRPAASEATRLAAFLTNEKLASISAGLVRAAQQPVSRRNGESTPPRSTTPVSLHESDSSHPAKRPCVSNSDRQSVQGGGDYSPPPDDLLACGEHVDSTPETLSSRAQEQAAAAETDNAGREEVILQTFSDALRELAYAILPNKHEP